MTLPEVDLERLEAECDADRDVLANLAANGDRSDILRSVDVSFRGDDAALDRLEDEAASFGFTVLEREETDEEGLCLFLAREQKSDAASIRALTLLCLQIEIMFDVEYDGWGCVAETGLTH